MAGKTQGVMFQFTAPIVLAFPNLFTPRKYKDARGVESGEPKYDFRAIVDLTHPDLPALRDKLVEAAKNAWPNADLSQFTVDWCLRNGDEVANKARAEGKDREWARGKLVLTSRGQYAPGLSYVANGRIVDAPMSGNERMAAEQYFYGGVEVLVQIQLVGYQVGNNTPVVTAYPNVVLSLNKGERRGELAGGAMKSGAAAFGETVRGHISGIDPTASSAVAGLPI